MFKLDVAKARMLRIIGAVAMGFSVVMSLLVIFVIPGGGCTVVGGIQLLLLGFLFLTGMFVFLLGQWILWKPMVQAAMGAMAALILRLF